jgi:hypothetical protein
MLVQEINGNSMLELRGPRSESWTPAMGLTKLKTRTKTLHGKLQPLIQTAKRQRESSDQLE